MTDKILLKKIAFLSLFLGVVLGVIATIPFIGAIAFWVLMCLSSTCIFLLLRAAQVFDLYSIQQSSVLGALIGFLSFIGFATIYIPVVIIFAGIFKIYLNYGVSVTLTHASFGLIIAFVIFMGILSATINAFSGFLTFYGIDFYNKLQNQNNDEQFRLK